MKKILVIDDAQPNICSTDVTLAEADVTTCDNIEDARKALGNKDDPFDIVLTDLFLPRGGYEGAVATHRYGYPKSELPAGLVFALKAINKNIPVVICTDANHHQDWLCSLLDMVHFGAEHRVSFVEARSVNLFPYRWNEEEQKLSLCNECLSKFGESGSTYPCTACDNKPLIKDWLGVMRRSEMFPEMFSEEKILIFDPDVDSPVAKATVAALTTLSPEDASRYKVSSLLEEELSNNQYRTVTDLTTVGKAWHDKGVAIQRISKLSQWPYRLQEVVRFPQADRFLTTLLQLF